MAVIHDWKCAAHGVFEGPAPGKCPHGCGAGMVEIIYLQAPGFMSDKTKTTDRTKKQLAAQFGMTDVQARAGRPAMPDTYRWNQPEVMGSGDHDGVGKPYSVALDHSKDAPDVNQQAAAEVGAPQSAQTFASAKVAGANKFKANVVGVDDTKVTAEQIKEAE